MTRLLLAALAATFIQAVPAAAQQSPVVVIVHASNPTDALSEDEISRMLLKRQTRWPNGTHVSPVDLEAESTVRNAFTRRFHGRSLDAVQNYWQQQIFSGRETPPPVRKTDAAVIAFVAEAPGAIGYVAAGVSLPAGVRALQVRR
jgi:ABC-type phosphate transport system substrate-binding protein